MGVIKSFNAIGQPFGKAFPIPIVATVDPGNKDKKRIGQFWVNTTTPMGWFLVAYTNGLPVWIPLSGNVNDVEFLRGNDGLTASPLAGIINVRGNGTDVNVTRSPDINSLLITMVNGSPVTILRTQDGNDVTPTAGRIQLSGFHNLATTGTVGPNTATVNMNNAITLGDLANLAAGVPALTIATGDITFTATNNVGNINMVNTVGTTGAAGVVEWGGNRWIHNYGDAVGLGGNVFIGKDAGNFTLTTGTATRLVGIGKDCLKNVTTGTTTVAIGYEALGMMTSGSANVAIGYWTMRDATTAAQNMCFGFASGLVMTSALGNVCIGDHAANFLTTGEGNQMIGRFVGTLGAASGLVSGNFNIIIGDSAGNAFVANESNNILLNSLGLGADQNTLRVGRATGGGTGELNRAFIHGIYGITPAGATQSVIIDANGQLGSTAATGSTLGYTNVNTTPYVVLSTDVYLGVDCSGGPITIQIPNVPAVGRIFYIKDRTGSANTNNISVTTPSGVVAIDGINTYVMNTQYSSIGVIFNTNNVYEIF